MNMKFPVAVWEDAQGAFTARVLDGELADATDSAAAAALLQLKRYLTWLSREQGYLSEADFDDLELRDHRVRLRPEYRIAECAYPVSKPFELRITCVHGQRRDGSRHCVAPTLGLRTGYRFNRYIGLIVTPGITMGFPRFMTSLDLSGGLAASF